jgi:hypothetical protein
MDASMETAKSILELATNAESLWKTAAPLEPGLEWDNR